MDNEALENFQESITKKLGDEAMATIADDIANIITINNEALEAKSAAETEIQNLKSLNEKLVASNGSLLKQIPMTNNQNQYQNEIDQQDKEFNVRDFLNPDGTFKEKK